jgi:hypothetical protein
VNVIQQNVHWWIAKENVAQFQAQLKDRPDNIRRPMAERLLHQERTILSASPKVTPHF